MYSEPKRIDYLDSIRGLAALCVLISHTVAAFVWPPIYSKILQLPYLRILQEGPAAVVMFFVLSGYVLSKPYVSPSAISSRRRMFVSTFYLRRFTRIWLPWFAVFLISIAAKKYFFHAPATQPPTSNWLGMFWHSPMTFSDFVRQCTFTLHESSRLLLPQDWSLGAELKGSALIPVFIFLSDGKRWFMLLAVVLFFLILVGNGHYYLSFLMGVLIARYEDFSPKWFQRLNSISKALVLLVCLALYQMMDLLVKTFGPTPIPSKYGWLTAAIGCCGILLVVRFTPRLQKILNSRPLVLLGRVSYSVYLIQFIIILCLLPRLVRGMNMLGESNGLLLFMSVVLVSITATIACSVITYKIVEIPAINLGHHLTIKIQQYFKR
jgi:peptidoglycan/LPS O-acetylase OafA/YrhL